MTMNWEPALVQIVQGIVEAVALAVVALIGFYSKKLITRGIAYLESKVGESNLTVLKQAAATFVKMLEQSPLYQDLTNEAKLEQAISWMAAFCTERNLPFDHDFIHKLIEEAVADLKADIGPVIEVGELTEATGA